jgi:hypothetical protein
MATDASGHYTKRRDEARAEEAALAASTRKISTARVLFFLVAAGCTIYGRVKHEPRLYGIALAAVVLFVALVFVHDRLHARQDRAGRTAAWAEEGLARLAGRFARTPGEDDPKAEPGHPCAEDLDLFGEGSLFQSLDTTRTSEGRALLGAWLARGAAAAEVRERQAAARELTSMAELREALAVEGAILDEGESVAWKHRRAKDLEQLLAWAEHGEHVPGGVLMRAVALALPLTTLAAVLFGDTLHLPRVVGLASVIVSLLLLGRLRGPVMAAIEATSDHGESLLRFSRIFAVVEAAQFEGAPLRALQATLKVGGESAAESLASLRRIVGFVEARRNEVWKLFIGPVLLWDLHCALALDALRGRAGTSLRAQIEAIARLEALVALGTRAFEQPDDAWPEIVEPTGDASPALDAKGIAHPLIEAGKAVRNDVLLSSLGQVLLVTGSNMSGKSTLMRALGANVVLALAGAPVRAKALRCLPLDVRTSMRIRDDLHAGVSHFFAELRRLKEIVDAANDAKATATRPVLFLLDEILHGTNSRERHLGAEAIVRHLTTQRACGAVSTHDLALGGLETELAGRVRNVHFEEQVRAGEDGTETMSFDHRLRPGVVASSNALRLMRIVGIDVPLPAPPT